MSNIAGDNPENLDASGLDGEIITEKSALHWAIPAILIVGALIVIQFVSRDSYAQPVNSTRSGPTSAVREVTPSAVAIVSTPAPTAIAVTSSPTPAAEPLAVATLPAPLYYLGADSQIWRYAADGSGTTQITHELRPVVAFDISRADGSIAYIVSGATETPAADATPSPNLGTLMRARADGSGRAALAIGVQPRRIAFSPDGQQLAYVREGIELIPALGGEPGRVILGDGTTASAEGAPSEGAPAGGSTYAIQGWSLDGRTLLATRQAPGQTRIVTLAVSVSEATSVEFASIGQCAHPAWESDNSVVYCDGTAFPDGWPGLYRVDPATGQETTLLGGTRQAGATDPFAFVAFPQPAGDGTLYALTNLHGTDPDPRYLFSRITISEPLTATVDQIGTGAFRRPLELLWATDATGAVVSSLEDMPAKESPLVGEMQWVAVADGALQPLIDDRGAILLGANLRWGR